MNSLQTNLLRVSGFLYVIVLTVYGLAHATSCSLEREPTRIDWNTAKVEAPFFAVNPVSNIDCSPNTPCSCSIRGYSFTWRFTYKLTSDGVLRVNITQPHHPRADVRSLRAMNSCFPPYPLYYSFVSFSIDPTKETSVDSSILLEVQTDNTESVTVDCTGISLSLFPGCGVESDAPGPDGTITTIDVIDTITTDTTDSKATSEMMLTGPTAPAPPSVYPNLAETPTPTTRHTGSMKPTTLVSANTTPSTTTFTNSDISTASSRPTTLSIRDLILHISALLSVTVPSSTGHGITGKTTNPSPTAVSTTPSATKLSTTTVTLPNADTIFTSDRPTSIATSSEFVRPTIAKSTTSTASISTSTTTIGRPPSSASAVVSIPTSTTTLSATFDTTSTPATTTTSHVTTSAASSLVAATPNATISSTLGSTAETMDPVIISPTSANTTTHTTTSANTTTITVKATTSAEQTTGSGPVNNPGRDEKTTPIFNISTTSTPVQELPDEGNRSILCRNNTNNRENGDVTIGPRKRPREIPPLVIVSIVLALCLLLSIAVLVIFCVKVQSSRGSQLTQMSMADGYYSRRLAETADRIRGNRTQGLQIIQRDDRRLTLMITNPDTTTRL